MSLVIDYIVISVRPADTISAMKSQLEQKLQEGLELKSHVPDGMGNVIMTYQKSKPENMYRYHVEYLKVDSDPKVTIEKMNEMNDRLNRIGYTQKSMFLDGCGNFIVTFIINKANKNGRNSVQRTQRQPRRPYGQAK